MIYNDPGTNVVVMMCIAAIIAIIIIILTGLSQWGI